MQDSHRVEMAANANIDFFLIACKIVVPKAHSFTHLHNKKPSKIAFD